MDERIKDYNELDNNFKKNILIQLNLERIIINLQSPQILYSVYIEL